MPKIPSLTPKKVIVILKHNGFQLDYVTGSHYVFYHLQEHKTATVPFHNRDLPKGTLLSILKQAGIDKDELS